MPWQEAKSAFNQKRLDKIASEMEAAQYKPIILRHKKAIRGYGTGFITYHGFLGCRTSTMEKNDNTIVFSGKITADEPCHFFPDTFNVGYAVLPVCDRNLDCLAATYEENVPWIVEGPDDVIAEIKRRALALRPVPTPEEINEMSLPELETFVKNDPTKDPLVKGQSVKVKKPIEKKKPVEPVKSTTIDIEDLLQPAPELTGVL
jgi:hypothetical protein